MATIRNSSSFTTLPSNLRTLILRHPLIRSTRHYATYNTNATSNPQPSSVNDAEVSHFNALASSWWDPHGSSRLLHLMNPLRHRFLRQCLASNTLPTDTALPRKLKVLDIGCGGGIFAESAARSPLVSSVTAIDPTPEVIAVARRHRRTDPLLLEPGRLTYRNIPIEELPLPTKAEEGYDVISLFEVIEHIQDPSPFLRMALRHLKPGGWLVGSTIARTGVSWFTTKFIAEEVLRMVPRGTHEWKQYIQPHELRDWARLQDDLDVGVGGVGWQVMGVVYVPGVGWKDIRGSEDWGNYFFGVRKKELGE